MNLNWQLWIVVICLAFELVCRPMLVGKTRTYSAKDAVVQAVEIDALLVLLLWGVA